MRGVVANQVQGDLRHLTGFAMFGAVLSAAGLPIYIHAPKYFVDTYGVSLTALGTVLFGLRLLDVVQDPVLGKLASRVGARRGQAAGIGVAVMGLAMIGLFAVPPIGAPLVWFAITLGLVFSAFSFLTILFYTQGIATARALPGAGHLRLARWRETGALIGVCLASLAPVLLAGVTENPFAAFAVGFALAGWLCAIAMRPNWTSAQPRAGHHFRTVLQDGQARRLLILALVNAAPVAVSSTLFLFFVESRLASPGWEGPLLLLFFVSAALGAPFWTALATRIGTKRALMLAMVLAAVAFAFTLSLQAGALLPFAVICSLTGLALGADLTLLPAAFAMRLARISPDAAEGFGLWAFASKLSLALAAAALLPVLDMAGFQSGEINEAGTLTVLSWLYAGVPCLLKFLALGLLATTQFEEG